MAGLERLDWILIGLYFMALAAIVAWSARKQKSAEDYFLAGRNIGWFVIGGSLFASNIGSEHIVGLAGSGAKSGMAMAHYELHAWCLLVLGWVMVPFYHRARVYTMPEFLERRYNPATRWILSLVSLVAYIFTKVSVTVYAGGVVFKTLLPDLALKVPAWDLLGLALPAMELDAFWIGAISVVVLTGVYTILGGLRAVVYTDTLQAVTLIVGSLCVTCIGLVALGSPTAAPSAGQGSLFSWAEHLVKGWGELRRLCDPQHFNMWRSASDPEFPWAGILFGAPIVGLWYWCTDQYIVQRTLAARNIRAARKGTVFGAYLKLTPVFIFIVPGMIAHALAKSGKLELSSPDQAFPALVQALLWKGVRGLVVGGLLAALMSSLSSLFNSASTLFTVDIYGKIRPGASQRELVRVGRIATAIVVVLGIAWIPLMRLVSGVLYQYLQVVQAYLAPPITAVFFLGVFWKRVNAKGAVAAMVAGFALGMSKLAAQVVQGLASPGGALEHLALPAFVTWLADFNWLYFCLSLFGVAVAVLVLVSLVTPRPSEEKLAPLGHLAVGKGGWAALIVGLSMAAAKPAAGMAAEGTWLSGPMLDFVVWLARVEWLDYCLVLLAAAVATLIVVSVLTARPIDERTGERTWGAWDVVHTVIILSVIAAVYVYFRG